MSSPYIPFYTSDFLGGTGGMTAATKGVYITLLCLMYEAEEPLPQKWDVLARRCGCTLPAFKKAIEALEDDTKIIIEDGVIWSEKCEKHIAQRRGRSDSAKAAAKIRHEKTKQKQCEAEAGAPNPQCDSNANQNHSHSQNIDTDVSIYSDQTEFGLDDKPPKQKSRLPEGWRPDEEMAEYARSQKLNDDEIQRIADDFFAYWDDQPKSKSAKSLRGWRAAWRNRVDSVAWRYVKNRGMAQQSSPGGYGRGGSIADVVSRRRLNGEV